MKQIVFIDNDKIESAEEDIDYIKDQLESCKISDGVINNIKIIPDFAFYMKEKGMDRVLDIIFDKNNIIATWAVYTITHFGSLKQILDILMAASRNKIKDMVYIDGSGYLEKKLNRELKDSHYTCSNTMAILNAIEQNHIVSFDNDLKQFYELKLELKGLYKPYFKHISFDLKIAIEN